MMGYLLILVGLGGIVIGLMYATRMDRETDRRNAEKRRAQDALEELAVADWKAERKDRQIDGSPEPLLPERTEEAK